MTASDTKTPAGYLAIAQQRLYYAERHITEAGFPAAGEADCIAAMEAAASALVLAKTGLRPVKEMPLRDQLGALSIEMYLSPAALALVGGNVTSGRAYGVLADPSDVRRAERILAVARDGVAALTAVIVT